jgi:hypothetical protein
MKLKAHHLRWVGEEVSMAKKIKGAWKLVALLGANLWAACGASVQDCMENYCICVHRFEKCNTTSVDKDFNCPDVNYVRMKITDYNTPQGCPVEL